MKKTIIIIGLTILIGIGGYVLGKGVEAKPPEPVVTIDEKEISIVRGSYCWSSSLKSVCEDTSAPPDIVSYANQKPVAAQPSTEVTIDFDEKPLKDSIELSRWLNEEESTSVPLNDHTFVLPKEKGSYIYSVSARWDQGDAVYAFIIEVK